MMILWAIRFFVFKLYESPKYLMGRGRDQEAVDVVHRIARYNGVYSSLSVGELKNAESIDRTGVATVVGEEPQAKHIGRIVQWKLDSNHLYALFSTPKLAYSTSLLIIIWGGLRVYYQPAVD